MKITGVRKEVFVRIYYMHIQSGMDTKQAFMTVTRVISEKGTIEDLNHLIETHDAYELSLFKKWEVERNELVSTG
jgi:hypothetical protein